MVGASLTKYDSTINGNGEEDEQISCFKPGRPCVEEYEVLKEQNDDLQRTAKHGQPVWNNRI